MLLSYIRTILLYLILVLVVRVMGKRQIGEMEPAEFVVTMLLANLAAIPMQDVGIPLLSGLVPILTVLGVELILAVLSMRFLSFRRLLCGKPVVLIENGKILQDNLSRTRLTLDELTEHLREKGVLDLSIVKYAILETNGQLSVFPYAKYAPASAKDAGIKAKEEYLPYTIVSDGRLLTDNLTLSRRNEAWLQQELKERNQTLEGTLLLTVDETGKVYYAPKEEEL